MAVLDLQNRLDIAQLALIDQFAAGGMSGRTFSDAWITNLNQAQGELATTAAVNCAMDIAMLFLPMPGGGGTTRVGRWMSQSEFDEMSKIGRVIEGGGGRTYVAQPPNPAAYPSARPGSIYAEFDVPSSSLFPASKPEWKVIPGPNAGTSRFGPLPSEMPPATCIVWVCVK